MTQVLGENNQFAEIRRQKILDYAARRAKRSVTDKEKDFEEIDEFQQKWFEPRLKGNARSWERWNGMIEEWTPWNRFGEPINRWRYYKK